MPDFVPVFGGFTSWSKIVDTVVSQLKQNKQKTSESSLFCRNLVFVTKHQETSFASGWWKQKTLIGPSCVSSPKNVFEKKKGDVSKPLFSGGFWWRILLIFNPFLSFFGFYFLIFLLLCSCFISSCCCFERPLHLALNPPYYLLGLFCCFFLLLFSWRVQGSGLRATSLGPKPFLCYVLFCFCVFFCCFCFCSSLQETQNCFPPKSTFCLFADCPSCFLLSLFAPPLLTLFLLVFFSSIFLSCFPSFFASFLPPLSFLSLLFSFSFLLYFSSCFLCHLE